VSAGRCNLQPSWRTAEASSALGQNTVSLTEPGNKRQGPSAWLLALQIGLAGSPMAQ